MVFACWGRWRGGFVVFSVGRIPADPQHLREHAEAIHQGINAGASAMAPKDWNFLDLETHLSGKEKDLGIESPTLDFL